MCSLDLEPCSVWDEREVTARKRHACDCCGGGISPKSQYRRHFSIFEGDVTSEKVCVACHAARVEFQESHGAMPIPSAFPELLRDCFMDSGGREFWTPEDKRWRSLYAGILRRGRAGRAT